MPLLSRKVLPVSKTSRKDSCLEWIRSIQRRKSSIFTTWVTPAPVEEEFGQEILNRDLCFQLILSELQGFRFQGNLLILARNLTSVQLRDLIQRVLADLKSSSLARVKNAVRLLAILLQVPRAIGDQAADFGRSVYEQLTSSSTLAGKALLQEALVLLACHHTRDTVQVFLGYSLPLDGQVLGIWKAMGADPSIAYRVLQELLCRMLERPVPRDGGSTNWDRHNPGSIAAVNTLYELLFSWEYSRAMVKLFPQLFLAFILQIQYVLELGLAGEWELEAEEPTVPSALSPWRTALEALKGLLSSMGCWRSFTSMELQGGWQFFSSLEIFQEGVALLARTLVQSRCLMVADLLHMVTSSLQGKGTQGRNVAMGLLAELIWIPSLEAILDLKILHLILQAGLEDPDPVVRVISLQTLTSLPLNPDKKPLFLAQLPPILKGFYQEDEVGVLAAMDMATLTTRSLGSQGLGHLSEDIVLMLGPFFDDERPRVRAAALELLGAVADGWVWEEEAILQQELIRCLLPVLVHIKDEDPAVQRKARYSFFRLAQSLEWKYMHLVGWKLIGKEKERTTYTPIWWAMMESFEGCCPIFLSQALGYTSSPQPEVRWAAVLFLGYTIAINLGKPWLSQEELDFLSQKFQTLQNDPLAKIRRFVSSYHFNRKDNNEQGQN
ncbi:maestro heat-like repeat family member 5 isoform X2 [Ornithorhynchus anatinus]|uniref:maestro heat-like repeat family member 5 isoform X2 n=1 Tax=Ornithorhynchus anatinus TaxID=9258 RepID=UPI0010A78382|nr:maestro heat-like repeat family member 5 isoform X2 [Ornithorhynchus anatinus]